MMLSHAQRAEVGGAWIARGAKGALSAAARATEGRSSDHLSDLSTCIGHGKSLAQNQFTFLLTAKADLSCCKRRAQ